MNLITATDIRSLAEEHAGPCVSITMPTHVGTNAIQQDPIRLKNLLKTARQRLVDDKGLRGPKADDLLQPGWNLIEHGEVWREQGVGGIAVFLGSGRADAYRIPLQVEEQVVVNDRFFVKPLLPILHAEQRFFVLTLEQRGGVRLLECTPSSISELDLPEGTPTTMDEATRVDGRGNSLQQHTNVAGPASRKTTRTSTFESNSVDDQVADAEQNDFMHYLQSGVYEKIKLENAPLVLVGTEFMQSLYRDHNRYSNLYPEGIVGTPKYVSDRDLQLKALDMLQPYFDQARQSAFDRFREYYGTGRASVDPAEIVPAAAYGRVESLLVADGTRHEWGRFKEDTGDVIIHDHELPGDDDLADFAVARTILTGGKVFHAESTLVPNQSSMAAVFRY